LGIMILRVIHKKLRLLTTNYSALFFCGRKTKKLMHIVLAAIIIIA